MSGDDTVESEKSGNVVPLSKRRLPSRKRMSPTTTYPVEWRNACHEMMVAYQTHLQETQPTRAGAMTIRNHIMEGRDEPYGFSNKNDNLTARDVSHWLKNNTFLSPIKFSYIDEFIKKIQIFPKNKFVRDRIIKYKEDNHKSFLRDIYTIRSQPSEWEKYTDRLSGKLYRSGYFNSPLQELLAEYGERLDKVDRDGFSVSGYREIWIYVRNFENYIASVTVIYCLSKISELNKKPRDGEWAVTHGYLIPMRSQTRPKEISGFLKTFRMESRGKLRDSGFSSSIVHIDLNRIRAVSTRTESVGIPLPVLM